jgi:hypothetical protein
MGKMGYNYKKMAKIMMYRNKKRPNTVAKSHDFYKKKPMD